MIKEVQVFCDLINLEVVNHIKRHATNCCSNLKIVALQETGKGSFWKYWENTKTENPNSATNRHFEEFHCYVTDHRTLDTADLSYAIFTKRIPSLCLAKSALRCEDRPELLEDYESLQVSSAEEAIKLFFSFPGVAGRVFVIEGGDGAGKQTQTALLVKRLSEGGRRTRSLDFPHDSARYGNLIREILRGKYGIDSLKVVSPLQFASLFALNRFDTLPLIKYWVHRGYNIVLDRYMTANFGFMACKFDDTSERKRIIEGMKEFETNWLELPAPHRVIYLNLDPKFALEAMLQDATRKELDLHEMEGLKFKTNVQKAFLWCCETFPEWTAVDCVENERRLTKEEVHQRIYAVVKDDLV
jgi:dTMP kinase